MMHNTRIIHVRLVRTFTLRAVSVAGHLVACKLLLYSSVCFQGEREREEGMALQRSRSQKKKEEIWCEMSRSLTIRRPLYSLLYSFLHNEVNVLWPRERKINGLFVQ